MKIAVTMKAMILSMIAVLEKVFQLWQILMAVVKITLRVILIYQSKRNSFVESDVDEDSDITNYSHTSDDSNSMLVDNDTNREDIVMKSRLSESVKIASARHHLRKMQTLML